MATLLSFAVGCGGGGSDKVTGPAPTPMGTILFKVDAQSCTGTAALDFFIDGSLVGTETMAAGSISRAYSTPSGQHVVGAAVSNTRARVWPSQTVLVPTNGSYTAILTCV